MGMPSSLADIEDKAIDNRIAANAFANGSAGAAGIDRSFYASQIITAKSFKAKRAEADARKVEERTRRLVDDTLVWNEEIKDVIPLRKMR